MSVSPKSVVTAIPLHYDEKVAQAIPFGAIVAQGGVTTSAILNAVDDGTLALDGDAVCY